MQKLIDDIAKKAAEYSNVEKFIQDRQLVKYEITRFVEESLPVNFYIGKYYLIRNKGIIEVENGFSYHVGDIRFSGTGEEIWECTVTFHNVTSKELNGMDTSEDIVSYNSEHTAKFILALLKSGFVMYFKP